MSEQSQQIPMNMDPNAYTITNMSIIGGDEEIGLQIMSGNQMRMYTVNPKHAKRILMLLQKTIADYEAKFGELQTELPTVNNNQTEAKKFGFQPQEEVKNK